jgi:hypothetical protein
MRKTTRKGLQSPKGTPLTSGTDAELLNATSLQTPLTKRENSKPLSHCGSEFNSRIAVGMSQKHSVFVLSKEGKPLTPTTPKKAKKLLKGKVAKPVWNKFGHFGIQMQTETRQHTPKSVLGVDNGTKFEGYAVVVGKENNLSVMWRLPNKKKIVAKLEERRQLRRARRFRNCRRRECRIDNRDRKGFIAPSQMVMVQSRIKAMQEFFKCYPIGTVALEDVRFNHRDKRWGKNFSTIEIGKKYLADWIRQRAGLQFFSGYDTKGFREAYGYKKSSNKGAEVFNSHCSDALALATYIFAKQHIQSGDFLVVDDTYRAVRRRLHDSQFSKGGIREKYSTGSFKGIRKGTICNFGQICGGIKGEIVRTYDWENKRLSKSYSKVAWLSHRFKTNEVMVSIPLYNKL